MSVHLHRTRQWTAWILTATALSPFALCFASTETKDVYLSPVTGRVLISGRPANEMTICLDSGGVHCAFGIAGGRRVVPVRATCGGRTAVPSRDVPCASLHLRRRPGDSGEVSRAGDLGHRDRYRRGLE